MTDADGLQFGEPVKPVGAKVAANSGLFVAAERQGRIDEDMRIHPRRTPVWRRRKPDRRSGTRPPSARARPSPDRCPSALSRTLAAQLQREAFNRDNVSLVDYKPEASVGSLRKLTSAISSAGAATRPPAACCSQASPDGGFRTSAILAANLANTASTGPIFTFEPRSGQRIQTSFFSTTMSKSACGPGSSS